jgi:hypothetical protein
MSVPLQVVYWNTKRSASVENYIRERVDALEKHVGGLTRCRVVVAHPHSHHRYGAVFCVQVDLTGASGEVVVLPDPADDYTHEDVFVAIRDAFDDARHRLEEHVGMAVP